MMLDVVATVLTRRAVQKRHAVQTRHVLQRAAALTGRGVAQGQRRAGRCTSWLSSPNPPRRSPSL
eukprot:2216986-Rhodomonas_salina.1